MFSARPLKLGLRELILQQAASNERLFQSKHRGLNQLAHNHASARCDGGPAVRHLSSIGLGYINEIVIKTERFCSDLRKDRVCALANLRAGRENLDATFRCSFGAND